jgi:selenide,water dikinase
LLPGIEYYLEQGCVPGGTQRNFDSYGHRIAPISQEQINILCDPQTSGGLLVAVEPSATAEFLAVATELGLSLEPIGQMIAQQQHAVEVV